MFLYSRKGAAISYVFRIKYRERWSPDAARGLEMYVHAGHCAAPADARVTINKNRRERGNGPLRDLHECLQSGSKRAASALTTG